jgi:hypothetical protein
MLWLKDQAPHASPRGAFVKLTLKSAAACVKATSRSSTARPQEKDFLMVRRRTQASVRSLRKLGYGAVSNHESPDAAILRDAALRLLLRMRAKDFG